VADLVLTRLHRPSDPELELLAAYDVEAFGKTGLRTYDLAVVAEVGAMFVARNEEEVVGACELLREMWNPAFFYIVGFYVRPEWQGQGLGRRLLQGVAGECRALGAEGLLLTVSPDNIRAITLYRRMGFEVEDFIPHFYGTGEDRCIMRWRFEPHAGQEVAAPEPGR
jgi:ribosomal protein S18 acetylase RimI-like enzyme